MPPHLKRPDKLAVTGMVCFVAMLAGLLLQVPPQIIGWAVACLLIWHLITPAHE